MGVYGFNIDSNTRLRRVESGRQYQKGGKFVYTKAKFGSTPLVTVTADGKVDLTSSSLTKIGSLSPTINDQGFAATATTTSLHIYWDGTNGSSRITIRRADGTKQVVPKGDLNVTGLSSNTKYYFYPFWAVSAMQLGWVIGTVGSPKIAFTAVSNDAAQQQNLQDREALTAGAMNFSTPAAGTSSPPAGGGGAPGYCVKKGTVIEPLFGQMRTKELPQSEWVHIETANGFYLDAVPGHRVYCNRGLLRMDELDFSCKVVTERGEARVVAHEPYIEMGTKVSFEIPDGHLGWTNGILSHNQKMFDPP